MTNETNEQGATEVTPEDPQVVGEENLEANQDAADAEGDQTDTPAEAQDSEEEPEKPDFGDGYDDAALEAKESDADFDAAETDAKEQPL